MQAQRNGTQRINISIIVWAYGDTMHVQKNNPIGTRGTCVYKEPEIIYRGIGNGPINTN